MIVETMLATFIAFCRIGTFLFLLPFMSGSKIPMMAKVILGMAISLGVSGKIDLSMIGTTLQLLFVVITQVGMGLALAKLVEFLVLIPKMAGTLIDFDLGFSMAEMIGANSESKATISANLLDIFFVIVFIFMNGLEGVIFLMVRSFDYTASIAMLIDSNFKDLVVGTFMFAITAAVQIALPLTGTIFILHIILAIMAKNAPQLNVFMNSFAVKTTLGILFVGMSVLVLGTVFQNLSTELLNQYQEMFDYFLTK